ncbi:UNVERIFIED_CONTAM: iron complex transport system substrate-binding protein [Acetivibrio alkalicellulosi]
MFKKLLFGVILCFLLSYIFSGCNKNIEVQNESDSYKTVKDMWDREVLIKRDVKSAVIMEWEGLATKSMKIFGLEENIVGVDNYAKKNTFRNEIAPVLKDIPDIGSAWTGVNYETLAKLNPDVVFMELWVTNESEKDLHADAIDKIESLGIPVIAFVSPSCYETPDIETAWRHISIVGEVFNKQKEAKKLIDSLNDKIEFIRERTKDIPEDEKANVVIFATSNYVMGKKSIQSYFLTEIINANNLVLSGDFVKISEEQLLNFDPEVLIVTGHDGYLDPSIIFNGEQCGINWGNVQDLSAIKNNRVVSLGYEEWRATIETPIALLKMAKAIYPEKFEDIDIDTEELKMYMEDYNLSKEEALRVIEAQKYTASLGS